MNTSVDPFELQRSRLKRQHANCKRKLPVLTAIEPSLPASLTHFYSQTARCDSNQTAQCLGRRAENVRR